MTLPTLEQIEALHRKYAPSESVFSLVFTHCMIIKYIAEEIITNKNLTVNNELVVVGAMIHDIGAYTLINKDGEFDGPHYIQHGVKGYAILKKEGFSDEICDFTIHHTGVGISKEDILRQHLELPVQDYLAKTLEEKIIMYADKFHSKKPQFNTFESYSRNIQRFGEDKVEKLQLLRDEFGIPDIESLAKKYNHPIV